MYHRTVLHTHHSPTGTVVVLGANTPQGEAAVQRVVSQYQASMGYAPLVFEGSSHGALAFGVLHVRRRT